MTDRVLTLQEFRAEWPVPEATPEEREALREPLNYSLAVTCRNCGHRCVPLTEGQVIGGREQVASIRCTWCQSEWVLRVELIAVWVAPDEQRHGTAGAYNRHRRRGEEPCRACNEGHVALSGAFKRRRRAARSAEDEEEVA